MVLKNVENKIKLVTIVCSIFLAGCIVISLGAVFTARQMVNDAHKQIYVLDSNVPILVKQTPQEMTLDIEAKADIDMFHHLFFTLAPDDKYIRYTIDKAMYLVDETGLAQYNQTCCSASSVTVSSSTVTLSPSPIMAVSVSSDAPPSSGDSL